MPTVLLAEALAAAGDVEPARELLLGREEELLAFGAHPGPVQELVVIAAFALAILEEWPRAERLLDGLIPGARRAGAVRALAFPLAVSAGLDVRRGHWNRARRKGREALPIAEETSPGFALTYAIATLAFLDAAQGRERSCRELAARLERVAAELELRPPRGPSAPPPPACSTWGSGASTRPSPISSRPWPISPAWGLEHPGFLPAEAYLIEALTRARRVPEARARQAALEERAQRSGGWWPRGSVALGAACSRRRTSTGTSTRRASATAGLPGPFDVARTELASGRAPAPRAQAHRGPSAADRRAARASTVSGLGHGRRAHGPSWPPPRAAAPRPAAADEAPLTHKEGEVADLVAANATNREAAAALFLSPRTVEHHLRQVYRKLGVRSRTELAAAYGAREVTPRPPADRNR